MYKARVDAVKGSKIWANGKWLNCIGNRAVKVGDSIWTDGRCAYGNDIEAQSPIVIAKRKPEDTVIPVQLDKYLYYFKGNKLEQVGLEEVGEISGRILNDKKNIYSIPVAAADAANCSNGDIYTLKSDKAAWREYSYDFDLDNLPGIDIKGYIKKISKNKTEIPITEISLTNLLKDAVHITYAEAKNLPYLGGLDDGIHDWGGDNPHCLITSFYESLVMSQPFYSFIENDNNWAFVFYISSQTIRRRDFAVDYDDGEYVVPEFGSIDVIYDGGGVVNRFYYFDSSGRRELIYNHHVSIININAYPMKYDELKYLSDVDFSQMANIKFPLQDGCYFKANVMPDVIAHADIIEGNYEDVANAEFPVVKYDIYSPENKLLFSSEGLFDVNFSICRLSGNDKYLVGLNPKLGAVHKTGILISDDNTIANFTMPSGLYICENAKLINIPEAPKNTRCLNHCLRPFMYSKNWWKKIQKFKG